MKQGFDYNEAKDMLGLAISADLFAPMGYGKTWQGFATREAVPVDNKNNPIDPITENFFPYPEKPIWPKGWTPGRPTKKGNIWNRSIISSSVPGFNEGDPPMKSNGAMFSYNKKLDAYCIAFAGTSNHPTIMQDILDAPVYAGPGILLKDSKTYRYMSDTTYITDWEYPIPLKDQSEFKSSNAAETALFKDPPRVQPKVSLGIRFGLESLTIRASKKNSLLTLLRSVRKKKINLFLTGHSLGAGIASLFAAWLQAGNIPNKEIQVKTYVFGSEKIGNDVFVKNYNIGSTNSGFHFVVSNTLDLAPQMPITTGEMHDLVNPNGTRTWLPYLTQELMAEFDHLMGIETNNDSTNTNYFHPGSPITLQADFPVVYHGKYYPSMFFPGENNKILIAQEGGDPFDESFARLWWQHMPWNYRYYLDRRFGQNK